MWQTASVDPESEHGAESPVARKPRTRTRGVRVFDQPLGPPPALLGLTVGVYALCAVALVGVGVVPVATHRKDGWEQLTLFLPIVLYCGALAWTASRIRSRSPEQRASAWLLAPVLWEEVAPEESHGVAGSPLAQYALLASMIGMTFGWVLALPPLLFARRAVWFFLAALSGPVLIFVLFNVRPHWL
jgi:hypothetical protein